MLRYARFAAEGRPLRGTIVLLPGRSESIEKYFETISDLSKRGFGVAIFDLRGQGGSDRLARNPRLGFVTDFQDYVADIEPFFQDVVLPDCRGPYFVLGHSTGALVALLAAPALSNRVQRMMLLSPLFGLAPPASLSPRNTCRLCRLLHATGLGQLTVKRPDTATFDGNLLTSDAQRYDRNQTIFSARPELGIGGPTATWVRSVFHALDQAQSSQFKARVTVPILVVAASADRVVDTGATERYVAGLRTASLLTIQGARHELLQERDIFREQLLAAFDAFIPGSAPDPFSPAAI
ncbi:alpha/beta hydrolase [Aerobium aerolatum]